MSDGRRIPFDEAFTLAKKVAAELRPVVVRSKAVGSLRRRKPHVSDIEFVVEPKMVPSDLFGNKTPRVEPVRKVLQEIGTWIKGGERYMAVTDLYGADGVRLDVFLVSPPAQWGSQVAIRTGPADLGKHCMVKLKENGMRHTDGHVEKVGGELVPTPDEKDFFRLAGVKYVPPARRDSLAWDVVTGEAG